MSLQPVPFPRPMSHDVTHAKTPTRPHLDKVADALALIESRVTPSLDELRALSVEMETLRATIRHQSELLAQAASGEAIPAVLRFAAEWGIRIASGGPQR